MQGGVLYLADPCFQRRQLGEQGRVVAVSHQAWVLLPVGLDAVQHLLGLRLAAALCPAELAPAAGAIFSRSVVRLLGPGLDLKYAPVHQLVPVYGFCGNMVKAGLEDVQMDCVDVVEEGIRQDSADAIQPQLWVFFRVNLLAFAVLEVDDMQVIAAYDEAVGCAEAIRGNT